MPWKSRWFGVGETQGQNYGRISLCCFAFLFGQPKRQKILLNCVFVLLKLLNSSLPWNLMIPIIPLFWRHIQPILQGFVMFVYVSCLWLLFSIVLHLYLLTWKGEHIMMIQNWTKNLQASSWRKRATNLSTRRSSTTWCCCIKHPCQVRMYYYVLSVFWNNCYFLVI